jgi:cell division protein FtsI (penicillin-binding protein 3)
MALDKRKEILYRAYVVVGSFSLIALVIAYKVFVISFIEGKRWKAEAEKNVKWMPETADRGNIYSDDELLLSTSIQFFEIRMDLTVAKHDLFKRNVDSLALMLSKTIEPYKSESEWRKEMYAGRKKKNRYFFIAKGLDAETVNMLRTFPLFRDGKYGGGYVEIRYGTRKKPYGELASRTIGADRINADKVGLEGYYDKYLKGPSDKRLMKRIDATNNIWVPVYDPSEFQTKKGDDIITSLNVHLQDVVHNELEKQLIQSRAEAGTAVLMEVKTGAIKAISNLVIKDSSVGVEILNTAVVNRTEPGSTFKLATVLALLEDSLAQEHTLVNINGGQMKFADKIMKDSEPPRKNLVTMSEAFASSSNVGISKLANDAYNRNQQTRAHYRAMLTKFGLDKKTGIDLSGEESPVIKDPIRNHKEWYSTTIPWMSHGYETMMSPLQLLGFFNAVANGGTYMKPYLVSEIRNGGKVIKKFGPSVKIDQIAKSKNIAKVKKMMEAVFEPGGTAAKLASAHVKLAGKTGTTRTNYSNKAEDAKYNASFAGYFPAENPEYSMIIVVYNPKGAFYGASVAAPIFKNVAEKTMSWRQEMLPAYESDSAVVRSMTLPDVNVGYGEDFIKLFDYIGLKYKKTNTKSWVNVKPFDSKMIVENKSIAKGTIPNVIGMGARDAVYVLENLGLEVSIFGKGKVAKQSLTPGTSIKGQRIEIMLQ